MYVYAASSMINSAAITSAKNSAKNSAVPTLAPPTSLNDVLNLVSSFTLLGGSVWIVWGVIVLAGSLKDKNGPALQSASWQIIGGLLIASATYLFKNIGDHPLILNDVLGLAAKFSSIGGALWTIWGVIILASALKDKTGPTLQAAIWQIVGGLLIMVASHMFTTVIS
jgi:hypothetical protein